VTWANARKFGVAILGAALTIGFQLGLTGTAQQVLTGVAAIATALGVYTIRNGPKPVETTTVLGTGKADIGPMGS
jgi:hypothetical protein